MAHVSNVRSGPAPAVDATPAADAPIAPAVAAPASRVTIIDSRSASVVDGNGRSIKMKRLSALDRMRLFAAVGSENSANNAFMSYASTAACATEIDGAAVAFPSNRLQLDALVARLDEAGLEAIVEALVRLHPEAESIMDAAKNS